MKLRRQPPEGKQKNKTSEKASTKGRKMFSSLGRGGTGANLDRKDPPLGDEGKFVVGIRPTKASSS